jgi:hypothetical protein
MESKGRFRPLAFIIIVLLLCGGMIVFLAPISHPAWWASILSGWLQYKPSDPLQ